MTAKQTSVRIELFKITGLLVLLVAGGLYIAHIGAAGTQSNTNTSPLEDPGDYRALDRDFAGQAMPLLTAHEASTGRKEGVSIDAEGMVVLIAGTACVQQQISGLRQAQTLYESIEKDMPIRVVVLTNDDEVSHLHLGGSGVRVFPRVRRSPIGHGVITRHCRAQRGSLPHRRGLRRPFRSTALQTSDGFQAAGFNRSKTHARRAAHFWRTRLPVATWLPASRR